MKILYIEDNLIDRKNMEWVCRNFKDIDLSILKKFDQVEAFLSKNTPDYVFTDRRIGSQDFGSYVNLWSEIPYYVLSSTIFENKNIDNQPIAYLQKPITKSTLEGLLFEEKQAVDEPNMSYFEQIPDEDLQKEMKTLLIDELENVQKKIPVAESLEDLTTLIHNLAGKFSLLGMEESFDFSKELEYKLRDGKTDETLLAKVMKSAEVGIQFLEQQNK